MIKSRLAKLEKAFRALSDVQKVFIVQQDERRNSMEITGLNFSGTIEEGRRLLADYPHCTVIIDDIPRTQEIA